MELKKDFPIFKKEKELIYFDSAATTQKPSKVIEAMNKFYESENSNIHRGIYELSENATKSFEKARETVASFIKASSNEIIFTKGTTESINLLSHTLSKLFGERNEILVSKMEHHSNFVPWQQLAKKEGLNFKYINITKDYGLDYEDAANKITDKTAVVAITHISNSLGTINDIKRIIKLAKEKGAITIIDAAQSIQHLEIDVKDLDCDFLTFSGHKVYGPMGIGVLYGKKELLEKMPPFNFGGSMISNVSLDSSEFAKSPRKFEAGTQNVVGAIGLEVALDYIKNIGINNIKEYEQSLLDYTLTELEKIEGIKIYAPKEMASIVSFNLEGIHAHDLASLLNDENIAIRAGHHCCMPLMSHLGVQGTARISLSIYNTKSDIDVLVKAIKKTQEVFK